MSRGGPNRSTAVMQRRHEAPDALDDYPTPPWATRALCAFLAAQGQDLSKQSAWDPACNRGYMVRPLAEVFAHVHASDVHDYGWDGMADQADFLLDWGLNDYTADWIITNPPFRLGAEFIHIGLRRARIGVAVLVRSAFSEGVDRYETLFRDRPETWDLPFVERVVMQRGKMLDPDVLYWDPQKGEMRRPSTATAYSWLVWRHGANGFTEKHRIPPCRRDLTRPGDYPPLPDELRPPQGAQLPL